MRYTAALEKLLALEYFGMKLGLENIERLLSTLGKPQQTLQAIHVAGTNGKGSVCATIAAILQSSGLKIGLYTSPHLVDYRERIRVNGIKIPEDVMEQFVERVWPTVEELRATFFEVTTALALDYFKSEGVDLAVIETGLGGRLDATNVIPHPLATVITSIGLDHTQQLGQTVEAIALEKAGIFKSQVPAIVNVQNSIRELMDDRAKHVDCPIHHVADHTLPAWASSLKPSLSGEHQRANLKTALVTLDVLGYLRDTSTTRAGIERLTELAGFRARFQRETLITEGKQVDIILDVAHNEDGVRAVVQHVGALGIRPIIVFGAMRDKDVRASLARLAAVASELILVRPRSPRASSVEELMDQCERLGIAATVGGTVQQGMAEALHAVEHGGTILLLGSHYVVGEYLANESKIHPVVESER